MIPDLKTFLIVCPLVLLAGFVDAIGGGGGLISLPAYLLAGLPAHQAIATNKLSSTCGTALATVRFALKGFIPWRAALPAMVTAVAGAWCGAHLSLLVDSEVLTKVLYVVLPLTAILVLRKNTFSDREGPAPEGKRTAVIAAAAAGVIGVYDGFYGPGTGTFLIIAFSLLAKMDVRSANGMCKAINLATNATSLIVFLRSGQTVIVLGLAAAACNMLGNYLGAGLAIKAGSKITRPIILFVLVLLLLKVLGVF
ncbi:MAG: sulfite exporter TauE/SafE family protein [Ruminococcaceae bacterium]|nr:sulfite exporter TauE/SafE family protein [Oscillospiraceae bacterium]